MLRHFAELGGTATHRRVALMRRSIATVCLSGTLDEKLVAAARAGFDGVELFEADLSTRRWLPPRSARRADELGLTVDLYQPFRDFEAVPRATFERNLRRAEAKFDVMEQLGAPTMLVCSNVSPEAIDDDELAAAQLRVLAERAGERGLRIAYEALGWGRHVQPVRPLRGGSRPRPIIRRSASAWTPSTSCRSAATWTRSPRSRARRSSTSSSRTLRSWSWRSCSGAATTAASRARARSTCRTSCSACSRPATRARCRWRSSTTSSARPTPTAPPSTRCARCSCSRTSSPARRCPTARGSTASRSSRSASTPARRRRPRRCCGRWASRTSGRTAASRSSSGSTARSASCSTTASATTTPRWWRSPSRARTPNAPRRAPRRCSRRCSSVAGTRGRPSSSAVAAPDGTSVFFCRTAAGRLARRLPRARHPAATCEPVPITRDRPHHARPAVRGLRRGGPVLPLGARPAARRERGARGAGRAHAQPRVRERRRRRPDRAQRARRWPARNPARPSSSTSRSPATTRSRPPARCTTAARRVLPIPDNYYDDLEASFELDPALLDELRELGVLYDRDARRRAPALLHRARRGAHVLRVPRAARRLRRLRGRQLAGAAGRTADGDRAGRMR